MLQLDVCLETVFPGTPAEDRIGRIAACGYDCVEFWMHDSTQDAPAGRGHKDPIALRQACDAAGVTINNFVVNPPDDGSTGGAPVMAAARQRYLERVEECIAFGKAVGCTKAITCAGNIQPGLSPEQMRTTMESALGEAAALAERHHFTLLLEPLNTHVDHAGYCLESSDLGAEIVRAVDSPALRLLYDVYHMQIMEGNVIAHIRRNSDVIGHFHSAGVPGRHELYAGELNYPGILRAIEETGYAGRFGLEYFPKLPDHAASLRNVRQYLSGEGFAPTAA